MKIAFVCQDSFSVSLFCKEIIRSLMTVQGAEVYVFSDDGPYRSEIEALGIHYIPIEVYRFFDPREDLRYFWGLFQAFRKIKFDIVLSFATKPNIYSTMAAKFAGAGKIFFHVVGLGSGFILDGSIKKMAIRAIFLKLYNFACKFSHRVWFTNKNDRAFFIENGLISSKKTVLTKNYLNISTFSRESLREGVLPKLRQEFGLQPDNLVVLMIARMVLEKGIKEFSEAAQALRKDFPKVRFLLIAPLEEGNASSVPESYIRQVEQSANVTWLPFRNDVRDLCGLCDLAVLPSYYKEGGYPRGLLEPMAMGKPVITTYSEDCRGAVDEGQSGLLVPIKDSKALAGAISELVSDPEKLARFGRNSRRKIEREFDESIIVPSALAELGIPVRRTSKTQLIHKES